jgi:hypothetical protein
MPPSQRKTPGLQWLLATYLPPNVRELLFDHNLFFSVVLIQINAGLRAFYARA